MSRQPAPVIKEKTRRPDYHWATVGIFILLLGGVIVVARDFLIPVVLASLLSLTFSPIRRATSRFGIAPPVTAVAVTIFVTGRRGPQLLAYPSRCNPTQRMLRRSCGTYSGNYEV